MNAALKKSSEQSALDEVKGSEVLEEAPAPKGQASSRSRSHSPAEKNESRSSSPTGSQEPTQDSSPDEKTGERRAPQPRYDSPSFDKWVSNNPEAAAELVSKRFKIGNAKDAEAWKSNFVALEQKRRRHHEANETELSAIQTEREKTEALKTETLALVQPHIDATEAAHNEDWKAFQEQFQRAYGRSFQDVSKAILRSAATGAGAVTPAQLAKISEQDRRIRELEAQVADKGKAPAAKTEPAAPAPKVSGKFIEREIDEDHGVRDLSDWASKVQTKYEDSYDEETEDFAMTVEDAANAVLDEFLNKRKPAPVAGKSPQRRPARRAEPVERTPSAEIDDDGSPVAAGADWNTRVRNALAKSEKRAAR